MQLLFQNGFEVTMLYTKGKAAVQQGTWELWENYWSSRGLHLVALPDAPVSYDVSQENAISHQVYLWLKEVITHRHSNCLCDNEVIIHT